MFKSALEEFNSKEDKPFELSIAYGCEYYENTENCPYENLDEVLKVSDKYMYKHKQILKSKAK